MVGTGFFAQPTASTRLDISLSKQQWITKDDKRWEEVTTLEMRMVKGWAALLIETASMTSFAVDQAFGCLPLPHQQNHRGQFKFIWKDCNKQPSRPLHLIKRYTRYRRRHPMPTEGSVDFAQPASHQQSLATVSRTGAL